MSDEQRPTANTPGGLYQHFCEEPGCKAWGSCGFLHGGRQVWFCQEHKAAGEKDHSPYRAH